MIANGYKRPRGSSAYGYGGHVYQYDYSHDEGSAVDLAGQHATNGAAPEKAASDVVGFRATGARRQVMT